jgi:hypothetical protein
MRPDKLQIISRFESLNTARTEIAPWSHVVRKNFQRYWLYHINTLEKRVGIFVPARADSRPVVDSNPTAPPHQGSSQFRRSLFLQVYAHMAVDIKRDCAAAVSQHGLHHLERRAGLQEPCRGGVEGSMGKRKMLGECGGSEKYS